MQSLSTFLLTLLRYLKSISDFCFCIHVAVLTFEIAWWAYCKILYMPKKKIISRNLSLSLSHLHTQINALLVKTWDNVSLSSQVHLQTWLKMTRGGRWGGQLWSAQLGLVFDKSTTAAGIPRVCWTAYWHWGTGAFCLTWCSLWRASPSRPIVSSWPHPVITSGPRQLGFYPSALSPQGACHMELQEECLL